MGKVAMRKVYVKSGETWEFTTGKGNAVIKNPRTGKKTVVPYTTLTGRDSSDIERGQWKRTSDGMVKPGHVRAYIEKHLLEPKT